ncbi:MAG: hypothetical protein KDK45_16425, partial [Leptospiraceae bacterium]|nr:hypothetical protein [Leptospiraceae bacterium]
TFYTSINPLVFQKIFSKEKNISLESIKFYPLLLSYQYESDDRKFNHYGLLYTSYENAKENYKNIAVLYNTYKTENLNEEFLIPLYYYKYNISDGSQRFNFLGLFDLQTSKNYTSRLFFPFYYSEKDKNSETLFATLYYSSKNLDTENQKQVQISPLSYTETVKSGDYERKTVLNPLYYKNQTRYKSEVGTETFIPALALWHSKDERQEKWNIAGILSSTKIKDSIEKAFLPFYYSFHSIHSEDITYIFPYYNKENSHSSISTLFPFYYYKQNKESENKETSFYSPLYIRETHSSENGIKSSSNLILPILLSFGKEGDTAKLSFAGLFHLSYDLSNLEILALPFYYFSQQDGKNVQASLLHYYKRDKNSELAINPIYSYGKDGKENEKEYKHWSLIPGLLYYSKETAEGVTKNIAGVFQYKKYPEYIQYHILPMLYYSKKKEDKKLFVAGYYKKEDKVSDEKVQSLGLGSLFYKKKKGNRVVKSILSGLLYYKDENNLEKKERELYLGGSLYYNLKKKQRGYRTRGLLAGLLWKQKTEEENAYKETSFLLDSFRVIRYKDKTSYRILGLRI